MDTGVEIPRRALFKSPEVCAIAKVPPYVLRSWEAEFPDLGVSKTPDAPRVYRRTDVEKVLRIKQLVYGDGLTLGAARRRLEGETRPAVETGPLDELFGRDARERIGEVKRGLREILDLLSGNGSQPAAGASQAALFGSENGPQARRIEKGNKAAQKMGTPTKRKKKGR